jgi:plastocyanin
MTAMKQTLLGATTALLAVFTISACGGNSSSYNITDGDALEADQAPEEEPAEQSENLENADEIAESELLDQAEPDEPAESEPAAEESGTEEDLAEAESAEEEEAAELEQESESVAATHDISISGFAFMPGSLTITVGDTVKWTNNDSVTHTVTSGTPGSPSGLFNETVPMNATFSYTFTQTGNVTYYCSIHTSMTGRVDVIGR